jgi:biotin carboxyl carrier protein
MTYTLRIAGRDVPVEIDITEEGRVSARIDGRTYDAVFRRISDNLLHLEIDGAGTNAYLADGPDGKLVNVEGITYLVQDAEALARSGSRRRGSKDLPQEVTPPMPSVVVRIMVAGGDRVEKGQGVVVVSAMKMETTLLAPFSGKVLKVNVSENDKVMPGQILVDIEKEEDV